MARSEYTIQPYIASRYFMQNHIRRMHACLAVTSHLHFRQNDRDLLRATAVTRGATDTEIRLSTDGLTLEKTILLPLLLRLKLAIFLITSPEL